MGVEYYTTRFLLQARARGCQFGRTLTIGRQNFFVTKPQLQKLASEFSFDPSALLNAQPQSSLAYVEPLLTQILKAQSVESVDVSTYEKATHVHDMNAPLPESLKGKFDTVLEAGSLEHIFNFPTALKNIMEAMKVGGTLFMQTPANNYFGHGFYQFSPELFFRALSADNGFEVRRMQVFEHFYPCHFFATRPYEVTDPADIQQRGLLVNNRPALLLIEARRVADKPIFAKPPQQSDYVPQWQKNAPTAEPVPLCAMNDLKFKVYSIPLRWVGRLWLQHFGRKADRPSLDNRDFFQPEGR